MTSKFAQIEFFVSHFHYKKISILGSLDNAENCQNTTFFGTPNINNNKDTKDNKDNKDNNNNINNNDNDEISRHNLPNLLRCRPRWKEYFAAKKAPAYSPNTPPA